MTMKDMSRLTEESIVSEIITEPFELTMKNQY
jgi:hypothetical protein